MVNKKMICLGIIIIILSTFTLGCVQNVPSKEIEQSKERLKVVYYQRISVNDELSEYDMKIIHDDVNKMTCYVYSGYKSGGLSCKTDKEIYENQIFSINLNI